MQNALVEYIGVYSDTNKGIHVNELNCPKHAVHVLKEQKKIFLNKKNRFVSTVCTVVKIGQTQTQIDTNTSKNIAIQCDLLFNKLIGKNQKKEVLTDNIGLISKFYNGLHNEGQFMDFINLAKGSSRWKDQVAQHGLDRSIAYGKIICLYNNL